MNRGAALAACLVLAAACSRAPVGPAGPELRVQHLEVLDGRTGDPVAAAALATRRVGRLDLAAEAPRLQLVRVVRDESAGGALRLRATQDDAPRGTFRGVIVTGLDWDADAIDLLELEATVERGGELRVHYAAEAPSAERGFPRGQLAGFDSLPPTSGGRTECRVAERPTWRGPIRSLGIEVRPEHGVVELSELAAVSRPMVPGASPARVAGVGRDMGLVTRVHTDPDPLLELHDARRAFPTRSDEPAFGLYAAGGPAALHVALGATLGWRAEDGPVTFEVAWSEAPDGDPEPPGEPVFTRTLDPATSASRWVDVTVELPRSDGTAAVWLTTRGGERGAWSGLWGAPQVERAAVARPPSALLITADTLRADHLGAYRAELDLGGLTGLATPNLDRLASEGTLFLDTFSVANATSPSHASILTSLVPRDHGVVDNRHRLADGHRTLAVHLRRAGFHTVHATAAAHLNAEPSGLGQGVDRFLEQPVGGLAVPYTQAGSFERLPVPAQRAMIHQGAEYGVPRALAALGDAGSRPTFLWLHLFDPHTPYLPRRETLEALGVEGEAGERSLLAELSAEAYGRPDAPPEVIEAWTREHPHLAFLGDVRTLEQARRLYAASISQMDEDLGELFDALDDTVIAFTSDHGEALGERGIWFNHTGVYQNTLHVPLILHGPGVPTGRVERAPVSTLDLAPTLTELVGAQPFPSRDGRSLVQLFAGDTLDRERRWFQHTRDRQVGFRTATEHVVLSLRDFRMGELGDEYTAGRLEVLEPLAAADRLEASLESEAARGTEWQAEIETWLADERFAIAAEQAALDAEAETALEALGYKE